MKDELISRKIAVLSKEKGFVPHEDSHPYCYYRDEPWNIEEEEIKNSDDVFVSDYIDREDTEYSAPTLYSLQRWLREVHSINILTTCHQSNSSEITYDYCLFIPYGYQSKMTKWSKNNYKTYEEALEDALQEGLNLIKL